MSKSAPGLRTVLEALGGLCAGVFDGVVEQSPLPTVEAAAEVMRKVDADSVVVLGGGSAAVTARAASIAAAEGGEIASLATKLDSKGQLHSPKLERPKALQFIVPSTPTTAYAKAGAAVTLPGTGSRLSLFDPKARAHAIFFDPSFFTPAPRDLTRDAALDCFAMGIQGLEAKTREPLADALLLHGLRLLRRHLPVYVAGQGNEDDHGSLMLASLLIGNGTDYTGSGLASALGHTIGARYGIRNGLVKVIVLPYTIAYNGTVTASRLDDAIEALEPHGSGGATGPEALIAACGILFKLLELPTRLRELGVPREDLLTIAKEAKSDFFYTQNPRKVEEDELVRLLEEAW